MPKTQLTVKSYSVLLSQLRKVFIEGLRRVEQEKVMTYRLTGKLISEYLLKNKVRADYASKFFDKLAQDLGINKRTLLRAVKFYRTFPIVTARSQLSWSHYRELSYVKDEARRKILTERAIKKEWGSRELEEAIRLDRLKIEEPKDKVEAYGRTPLQVTRSRLFTYQVLEPGFIHPIEERLVVDLGFTFIIQAEVGAYGHTPLRSGDIIESIKSGDTSPHQRLWCGDKYSFKHSDAKPKELYTYKALVERVVDADTILLNIDLGFSSWARQKVRLRGIDAPELSTKEGQDAKRFVEAKLKEVEFVVVKTYKSDKYDRYLADIFYPCKEDNPQGVLEQGVFLNQELLDLGLAVRM